MLDTPPGHRQAQRPAPRRRHRRGSLPGGLHSRARLRSAAGRADPGRGPRPTDARKEAPRPGPKLPGVRGHALGFRLARCTERWRTRAARGAGRGSVGVHAAVRGPVGGRQGLRGRDPEADGPVAAEMIPHHFSELPASTSRRGGPRSLRQGDIGQARAWEYDYAGAGRNGSRTPPILDVSLPGVPYASTVPHRLQHRFC